MRQLSAHYILHNSQLIQFGTVVVDERGKLVAIEFPQKPFKEQAGIEFYNGILSVIPSDCNTEFLPIQPNTSVTSLFKEKVEQGQQVKIVQISPIKMDDFTFASDSTIRVV